MSLGVQEPLAEQILTGRAKEKQALCTIARRDRIEEIRQEAFPNLSNLPAHLVFPSPAATAWQVILFKNRLCAQLPEGIELRRFARKRMAFSFNI